jgi:uncharacterized protein YegJ (DUF2314 family)
MILVRRVLGVIASTLGIAIWGWFFFNLVHPTADFRDHFRGAFPLVLGTAFLIFGWRWIRYQGPGIEDTKPDYSCPELTESVSQAKQMLSYFVEQVNKNVDGAFIKFPLKAPSGMTEHIWAYVHSYRDGQFNVSLANAPVSAGVDAQGRRDVCAEEVEDWQIMQRDGRIKGAYSMIALFRNRENQGLRLSPKMQKQKAQLVDAI